MTEPFGGKLKPVTLAGQHAHLAPLSPDDLDELIGAAEDGSLWQLWYTSVPEPSRMENEIGRRLALQQQGSMLPFTVREAASKRIVGMTTYMNIDPANLRLEIGSTWYGQSVQRTALNTCAKLLLLEHAFDRLECIAVEFRTHFFNRQSRIAIERLGAKLDGILRNHQVMKDGTLRDTCVYSIIRSEWPAVRANLRWLLNQPREQELK